MFTEVFYRFRVGECSLKLSKTFSNSDKNLPNMSQKPPPKSPQKHPQSVPKISPISPKTLLKNQKTKFLFKGVVEDDALTLR